MTRRKTATTASLPSEVTNVRHWRTCEDPFSTVWEQVRQQIEENPGLEAKTLFEWLQREYPGRTRTGRFGTWRGESSRVAALTAICSRCLLFGPSELISH
jgi:hypothetical protein